ncbi:MAG: hypothetical protein ACTSVF_05010 [Candidatus Asgardarchaeia archaeon]
MRRRFYITWNGKKYVLSEDYKKIVIPPYLFIGKFLKLGKMPLAVVCEAKVYYEGSEGEGYLTYKIIRDIEKFMKLKERIKEIKVALLECSISYVALSSNLPYLEVEVEDEEELNHVKKVIEYVLNERKFDLEEKKCREVHC